MQKTAYEMRSSDWSSDVCSSDLSVIPGGARHFGVITTPEGSIFDGRHIQDIARFDPGDRYDSTDVDDLHRSPIPTALVSSAHIKPVRGSTPDTVALVIPMTPAPPPTLACDLGYGTNEDARAKDGSEERPFGMKDS